MGHALWRKSIRPNIISWTEVLKPKPKRTDPTYHARMRPYETWRRGNGRLHDHPIYGEVIMHETDGVHAIVTHRQEPETPVEVHLHNLSLIKPPPERSSSPRTNKWGDLKPHIPSARAYFKDSGIKPTDDQLRQVAEMYKTSVDAMFAKK